MSSGKDRGKHDGNRDDSGRAPRVPRARGPEMGPSTPHPSDEDQKGGRGARQSEPDLNPEAPTPPLGGTPGRPASR
jgi:hypothetical protein